MTSSIFNQKIYETNLDLFSQTHALIAYQIDQTDFSRVQFCKTEKGEWNLYQKRYGITDYYHAMQGALEEAQNQAQPDILDKTQVIYFYGLGLGYIYEALKPWLSKNPQNHLVLLEDDLEVLNCFFYTERATEILQNPQVTLFYFQGLDETDRLHFYRLHARFINLSIHCLALPYYGIRYERDALMLCYRLLYDHKMISTMYGEYLSGQSAFLTHFYRHMLRLPSNHLGSDLFGKFVGLPAIICGAGPSIEKNIQILKTLKDRALIFAGGSSLNVLNSYGLIPHFGVGIDPNPEQYHRLLTNHTFHIPFFYRSRMAFDAFQLVPGPKLYIPGSANSLAAWFEKKLGIESPQVDEGHNVVNFCTEIAYLMGCNPIIYVGMDLAFTEVQTYAPGIPTHPLWLGQSSPYAAQADQQVIVMKGINGERITTKWEWIMESDWLSYYAQLHPSTQFINATEGGLGFNRIVNKSLADVAKESLIHPYDLSDWVHAEIQTSSFHFELHSILNLITTLKKTLETCLEYCKEIKNEKSRQLASSHPNREALYTTKDILAISAIQEEIGYQHFLQSFENAHLYLERAREVNKKMNHLDHLQNIFHRYQFLESILEQHLTFMKQAMSQFIAAPPPPSSPLGKEASTFSHTWQDGEIYQFDEQQLRIKDPELGLDIQEVFEPASSDKLTITYPNGAVKRQFFYRQQQLHGPSRFYSDKGILLGEAWFIQGLREGKNRQFYSSGVLYAIQRYCSNELHGLQEYFFENGNRGVSFSCQKGALEGAVLIFNKEGCLIRELHYHQNQRHGLEKLWSHNGQLLMECEYHQGRPIGTSRQWDEMGHLLKETIFHQFPQDFDSRIWDETGKLIRCFSRGIEDFSTYFANKQQKVDFLDEALDIVLKKVDPMIQDYADSQQSEEEKLAIKKNLLKIKEDVQKLHEMQASLQSLIQENLEKAQKARQQRME